MTGSQKLKHRLVPCGMLMVTSCMAFAAVMHMIFCGIPSINTVDVTDAVNWLDAMLASRQSLFSYSFRGDNCQREQFLPFREEPHLWRVLVHSKMNRKPQKLSYLAEMAKNLPSMSIHYLLLPRSCGINFLPYILFAAYLWQCTSNEYPQHMFSWRNKKNISIFLLIKCLIWSCSVEHIVLS